MKQESLDLVVKMNVGSIVHGTSTPSSDRDIKGIFVPAARELVLQKSPRFLDRSVKTSEGSRNAAGDVDEFYFSLHEYLKLLSEGETNVVDMLFTPEEHILFLSPYYRDMWKTLRENATRIIPPETKAFVGYCRSQANRYSSKGNRVEAVQKVLKVLSTFPEKDKLLSHWNELREQLSEVSHVSFDQIPGGHGSLVDHLNVCDRKVPCHAFVGVAKQVCQTALDRYGERSKKAFEAGGIDWKALSHAVRVMGECEELVLKGTITFPRPDRDFLLDVKLGRVPFGVVENLLDHGLRKIEQIPVERNVLRGPDPGFIEKILLEVYWQKILEAHSKTKNPAETPHGGFLLRDR